MSLSKWKNAQEKLLFYIYIYKNKSCDAIFYFLQLLSYQYMYIAKQKTEDIVLIH